MGQLMREIGRTINLMEMVFIKCLMVPFMKDNLSMVQNLAKANSPLQMDLNILEIFLMDTFMEMEYLSIQTADNTVVNGREDQ